MGTIEVTLRFLKGSSKRSEIMRRKFDRALTKLCKTRWIERQDAILQFRHSLLINIVSDR